MGREREMRRRRSGKRGDNKRVDKWRTERGERVCVCVRGEEVERGARVERGRDRKRTNRVEGVKGVRG